MTQRVRQIRKATKAARSPAKRRSVFHIGKLLANRALRNGVTTDSFD